MWLTNVIVYSTVFQDPVLLHLTIRENLTVGIFSSTMPSDHEIWQALERVGMRQAVEKLPLKLDIVMGEDSVEFSRGEVLSILPCLPVIIR